MGEVVPACTSPTLHPPSLPTVHQLSRLALYELIYHLILSVAEEYVCLESTTTELYYYYVRYKDSDVNVRECVRVAMGENETHLLIHSVMKTERK